MSGELINFITVLEYIGVFAFAVSGATVAIEEHFDIFGIAILATITAMGGGVLRDIVTDVGVPIFFTSYMTIPFIIAGTVLAIFFRGKLKYKNLFVFIDAIGLAAFFVSAATKSIDNNYNFMLYLFASSITGVGGGVLRDMITTRKPQIFRNDIYCVAGMIGVTIMWFLYPVLGVTTLKVITLLIIVIIRMVSYYKEINLPVILKVENEVKVLKS